MSDTPPLAAVVLAGGAGRRMGEPKASLVLAGTSLIERAVADARRAGAAPVVVATREALALPATLDAAIAFDAPGAEGPLAAVAAGLAAVPSGADVLLLACDLPGAAPVLERLAALPPGTAACAVTPDGRTHPLCARVPRDPALRSVTSLTAAGERRAGALLDALGAEALLATADEMRNLNTPGDLVAETERIERHRR